MIKFNEILYLLFNLVFITVGSQFILIVFSDICFNLKKTKTLKLNKGIFSLYKSEDLKNYNSDKGI